MSGTYLGPLDITGDIDAEGYRTYKVRHKVRLNSGETALTALLTPGLPLVGSTWSLSAMGLVSSEVDPWVWCHPEMSAKKLGRETESGGIWIVEQTFSSKPLKRCASYQYDNPLLEPQKVSGDYRMSRIEATHDIYGRPITNSSHEQITGPPVEFDDGSPTIRIEQNVANLQLDLLTEMQNTVNAYPMWGLPARSIKLSKVSWERKLHGACQVYFTRKFEFDCAERKQVRVKGSPIASTFDRQIADKGTKVLHGKWGTTGLWELININGSPPDPSNPSHFDRYKDKNGELATVQLDGHGKPWIPEPVYVSGSGNCSGCPGSTPQTWQITGFYDFSYLFASAYGGQRTIRASLFNVPLQYSSGCTWAAVVDGGNGQISTVTLEVDGGVGTLTILYGQPPSLTLAWRTNGDRPFVCTKYNVLDTNVTNSSVAAPGFTDLPGPKSIGVYPAGTMPQGAISVMYYAESDFSLLRIPMDLQVQI
ncbi:MAG TPA: hypothetical protein VD932_02655 [Aquabacterium sp.]|nr:hypothetical protein [Aquabacterium sp.]